MRVALLALVIAGCAPAKPPTMPAELPKQIASSASAARGTTTTIGKGNTRLYPLISSSWVANDALEITKDATLYVGASGERWLVTMKRAPTAEDPENQVAVLAGAQSFAPEALIAVRRRASGLLLVGESGATYPIAEPLDPLTTRRQPNEVVRSAAAGKDALLGLTFDARVLRSVDDGATWSSLKLPPSTTLPLTLAASLRGEVAALAAPGRLLVSVDDGATFKPIKSDGFGPIHVLAASDEHLWVIGREPGGKNADGLSSFTEHRMKLGRASDGSPALERAKGGSPSFSRPAPEGDDELALGDGVRAGTAAWSGLRYLELRPLPDGPFHAVSVEKGVVTHHPPIAGTAGCDIVGLATEGALAVAQCVRGETLTLFRSVDAGKTFAADATLGWGDRSPHHLWLSPKGGVIVDGVCLEPRAPDCDALLFKPLGAKAFAAVKLPDRHRVTALAMNDERVIAHAIHDESGESFLLVSKDGGRTFASRPMPKLADDLPLNEVTELALDGKIVVAIGDNHRLLSRDDGTTWSVVQLPFAADWISLAGARGLATSGSDRKAWETRDHGETWQAVELPVASTRGGTLPIACSELGCILGDIAIREGWEEPTNTPSATAATPEPKVSHRPLLDCVTEGAGVDLGDASRPEIDPAPTIAWMTAAETATGHEVVVQPRTGKLQHVPLLTTAKVPSGTRRVTSPDGVLVVRIPRAAPEGKTSVDAEVAWWVAATGKVHHATFSSPPLGKFGTHSGVAVLVPGYGAIVRFGGKDAPLRVAREAGTSLELPVPKDFPSLPRWYGQRKGTTTTLYGGLAASWQRDRVVAFASLPDAGPFRTWTWGVWPRIGGRTAADLVFGAQSLFVSWPGTPELAPRAFSLPFGDLDPPEPIALPDAAELFDAKPCANGQAPRIELAFVNGARTPIVVKDGKNTLHHATMATVGHGKTKDDTCSSAQLAGSIDGSWTLLFSGSAEPMKGVTYVRGVKPHRLVSIACTKSAAPLPTRFASMPGFRQ